MNLSTHVVGLLFAASALLSWTSLSFASCVRGIWR